MPKRVVGILAAALALNACDDRPAPEPIPAPAADVSVRSSPVVAEAAEAIAHSPPTSAAASVSLRRGLFFKDNYDRLVAMSREGDARATCQLATELDFCAGAQEDARRLRDAEDRIRKFHPPSSWDATLTTLTEVFELRGQYCESAPEASPSERARHWRLAAQRGHLASVIHYASGNAFQANETLFLLDDLKIFQGEAAGMMKNAAANGSFQAAVMLARSYSPEPPPDAPRLLVQALNSRDAVQSLAYLLRAEQIATSRSDIMPLDIARIRNETKFLRRAMSPDDVARAEQRFRELTAGSTASPAGKDQIDTTPYLPSPDTSSCGTQS